MNFRRILLVGLSLAGLCTPLLGQSPKAAGHWEGKIELPNQEVAMSLDLGRGAGGNWIGSMTIPGSTSVDVPVTGLAVNDSAVRFAVGLPGMTSFDGSVSPDGRTLSGSASSARGSVQFRATRTGDAAVKVPPPSSVLTKQFEGTWDGAVEANGRALRIGLRLSRGMDGLATGTLIAIDENLEIPVSTVTVRDSSLHLEARAASIDYQATLRGNGEIAGEWSQGGMRMPLSFKRAP